MIASQSWTWICWSHTNLELLAFSVHRIPALFVIHHLLDFSPNFAGSPSELEEFTIQKMVWFEHWRGIRTCWQPNLIIFTLWTNWFDLWEQRVVSILHILRFNNKISKEYDFILFIHLYILISPKTNGSVACHTSWRESVPRRDRLPEDNSDEQLSKSVERCMWYTRIPDCDRIHLHRSFAVYNTIESLFYLKSS